MRTAKDLMQELLAVDESHRIEVKRGTQIDRSVLETVCAFSNEPGLGGGYIILGISRDSKDLFNNTYFVSGLEHPDKMQAELATQCATMFNRQIRPRINVETLHEKTVLVVFVPEAAPADKPIFLKNVGLPGGAFRRIGSTDQSCSEDDLIALFAGHQQETYDHAMLHDTDVSDFDANALAEYRESRRKVNPDAEELVWSDVELLRSLGCVRMENNLPRPTVAGILLFGTVQALRRCFPMLRIDYIRVPGKQWVENPDHRFDTLEIRAPLLLAIRRATNAIRDELLQSFSLPEGALSRQDELTIPLRVIREAVVNATMHRSYRIHSPTQIIRYANRLEIRNPGHSLKEEEQLGEPGSESRNPRIAAVLHDLNIAETKGSGIRAMRELMLNHGLLPPTFESSRQPDQFVTTLLFHHFLEADDLVWLRQLTKEDLSDEESRALVFVRELGAINNAAYRDINRTDTLNASSHLRRLRDLGLLVMKGSGNRVYYEPSEHFVAALGVLDSNTIDANTHMLDVNTYMAEANTYMPDENTHMADPNTYMSDELIRRLPKPGEKPRREIIKSLILELCSLRDFSARELANILNRKDQRNLANEFLAPMVAAGELELTIPKMERHPNQKYRTPKILS